MTTVTTVNTNTFFAHPQNTLERPNEEVAGSWVFNKPISLCSGDRKTVVSMAGLLNFYEGVLARIFITTLTDDRNPDLESIQIPISNSALYSGYIHEPLRTEIGSKYSLRDASKSIMDNLIRDLWVTFFSKDFGGLTKVVGLGWVIGASDFIPFGFTKIQNIDYIDISSSLETCTIGWPNGLWDKPDNEFGLVSLELQRVLNDILEPFGKDCGIIANSRDFQYYIDEAGSLITHECEQYSIDKRNAFLLENTDIGNIITDMTKRCPLIPYGISQVMLSVMNRFAFKDTQFLPLFKIKKFIRKGYWIYSFDDFFDPVVSGGWEDWEEEWERSSGELEFNKRKLIGAEGFTLRIYVHYNSENNSVKLSRSEIESLPLTEDGNFHRWQMGRNIFFYLYLDSTEIFSPFGEPHFECILYQEKSVPNYDASSGSKGWPSKWMKDRSPGSGAEPEPPNVKNIKFTFVDKYSSSGKYDETDGDYISFNSEEYKICTDRTLHYDGYDFSEAAANHAQYMVDEATRNFDVSRPGTFEPDLTELSQIIGERWIQVSLLYPTEFEEGVEEYEPVALFDSRVKRFEPEETPAGIVNRALIEISFADFWTSIVLGDTYDIEVNGRNMANIGVVEYDYKHMSKVETPAQQ